MIFLVWKILAYSKSSTFDVLLSCQGKQIVKCTKNISRLGWKVGPVDLDKSLANVEGDAEIKEMLNEYEISRDGGGTWYLNLKSKTNSI